MKKYLCRKGLYPSGTYFIVEASSENLLLEEFNEMSDDSSWKSLCTVIREAFDDEWYEDEDGGLKYKGNGAIHKNGNDVYKY